MKKLLAITFLSSLLLISVALNITLFGANESNKIMMNQTIGQLTQIEREGALLQQRVFICESLLQEWMDMPETESHLFVSSEENSQSVLTGF